MDMDSTVLPVNVLMIIAILAGWAQESIGSHALAMQGKLDFLPEFYALGYPVLANADEAILPNCCATAYL